MLSGDRTSNLTINLIVQRQKKNVEQDNDKHSDKESKQSEGKYDKHEDKSTTHINKNEDEVISLICYFMKLDYGVMKETKMNKVVCFVIR